MVFDNKVCPTDLVPIADKMESEKGQNNSLIILKNNVFGVNLSS